MSADSKRQIGEARSRWKLDTDVATGNSCPAAGLALSFHALDLRGVAAAFGWALALHTHVAQTCRLSALRDLADLDSAYGIACHAWTNVAHRRDWWLELTPLTFADVLQKGRAVMSSKDRELELSLVAEVARLQLREIRKLRGSQRAACAHQEQIAQEALRECTRELEERRIDRSVKHAFDDKTPCR